MCGITGAAWTASSAPLELAVLERMTQALVHRGPDDAGYYHSAWLPRGAFPGAGEMPAPVDGQQPTFPPLSSTSGAALGFRRLSIIDLAGGRQPLSNEDGTIWIAFNGEIYNYRELHAALVQRGHHFRTVSDTETIVHLYEELGRDCVSQLRGMFALAIWDDRRKSLFLARDRLGKKPLVYRCDAGQLLFASELKALLQVPGLPRILDVAALDEYLTYQYVPHPQCILEGFRKLPPAHWAVFQEGRLEVGRYWRPGFDGEDANSSNAPRHAPLRELLTDAVRLRLRSDVPLGAFLSGGIDSTIIAGLMQRLSSRPVKTFSIGFPVKQFDEREFARIAAAHLGTEHHELVVEPSALDILPRLAWHYDEPFADSSAIPTFYLAEMTRREVTVALSGDGGDELFAGYDRYQAVRFAQRIDRLPGCVRRVLGAPIWQSIPASGRQRSWRRRLKRLLGALNEPAERRYLKWICSFDAERRRNLYTDNLRRDLHAADSADFLLAAFQECPDRDFVTRTTCVDVLTYLPCDILTKVDLASMAHGLEVRCPFLDQEVVQAAARLPISSKMRGGRGKRILIETFSDLLPKPVQQRAKMGFGVPLDHWFRGELKGLVHDVLLDPSSLGRGLFRPAAVEQLVCEHMTGQWDHSYRLWALLVFELWQSAFLDPAIPPSGPGKISLAGAAATA